MIAPVLIVLGFSLLMFAFSDALTVPRRYGNRTLSVLVIIALTLVGLGLTIGLN